MKNTNLNASVAMWWRKMSAARELVNQYRALRHVIADSQCDEMWPQGMRRVDDPEPTYQIDWGLKLDEKNELAYYLRVINAATREAVPLEKLPYGAFERYVLLRRALEEFLHADGDYPNPQHMPGGCRMEP